MEKYCVYAYMHMCFHSNNVDGWEIFQLVANHYPCNDICGYLLKNPINDNNFKKVYKCKRKYAEVCRFKLIETFRKV